MRKLRTTHTKKFDPQFRAEAVALVERSERPIAELATSLGMAKGTLYKWYRERMAKKVGRSTPTTPIASVESVEQKLARLEAENGELRKRVASLEEDKEILKKFAAFSVKEKT